MSGYFVRGMWWWQHCNLLMLFDLHWHTWPSWNWPTSCVSPLLSSAAHVHGGVSCSGEESLVRVGSAWLPSSSKHAGSDHLRFQNPRGAVRAPGQRRHEYPGYARTQALVSGPAEAVQCGEKGGRTDTGEGPEWGPVHQFLHRPHPWPSRGASRIRRRERDLGKENRLSPVGHWLRGGSGQCLEIPLLVLQKRRGWVNHGILIDRYAWTDVKRCRSSWQTLSCGARFSFQIPWSSVFIRFHSCVIFYLDNVYPRL